jgi:diguanylate cyclase (GGDEF)-like protein
MLSHDSVSIVDNLAEITSHHDRHVLEKSLLETLQELLPTHELRFYRVRQQADSQEIGLLASAINGVIVSTDDPVKFSQDAEISYEAISTAIAKASVEMIAGHNGDWNVIYPAFDYQNNIFAVLVISTHLVPSAGDQRLVYGILRVYSNYLALIEKTQKDKLTGLFNRETLDDEITKVLERQCTQQTEEASSVSDPRRRAFAARYWLGVIDIDHFKSINDSYGHLYGDEVLILVARLMTSGCIRDDDLVYRYGGEEFVVLLKAPNEDDAMLTFNRIRTLVEEHHFPQLEKVTISIGFVEVNGQQSPSDVIGQADEALYYAKQHGRNQVHSYQHLIEQGEIAEVLQETHGDVELF